MIDPKILMKIESDLLFQTVEIPEPMQADVYILASALQKAIRRGDVDTALTAAVGLWEEDRQRFYRRVHLTALEDIGLGDVPAVTEVLAATASSAWRRKTGDLQVALHLVRLLCQSVKSRMGDEVFIQAEKNPAFQDIRNRLIASSEDDLIGHIRDGDAPLVHKAIAIWALAGTRRYPSDNLAMRVGSLDAVRTAFEGIQVDPDFTNACLSVAMRAPWPLAIHAPLILAEAQRHFLSVETCALPSSSTVGGVPLYGLDQFTRLGKKCLHKLQKAVPDLRLFSASQIGHGVFYLEGCLLDRRIGCPAFDEYQQAAEITDMEATGICMPEYMALRECLIEHAATLQEIRYQELTRYLKEQPWKA